MLLSYSLLLRVLLAALAIVFLLSAFAIAAETVVVAPSAAVKWPYGDWIVGAGEIVSSTLLPALAAAAAEALRRVFPFARLFITTQLVERVVRNAVDYGLNAVEGAAKGKALSVNVGSAVLAQALQRGIDQTPGFLLKAAGGQAGLAEKIFRALDLAPQASQTNVLAPVLGMAAEGSLAHAEPEPEPVRVRRPRRSPSAAPAEA